MAEAEAGEGTLAELLAAAERSIERLTPEQAAAAVADGALLVDIRSEVARRRDGIVPGSLHVPRTVLEWRLEPGGAWRNPYADDRRIIVLCDHGCSSVLAAVALAGLGRERVADVIGGFARWREDGLPVADAPEPPSAGLPGMAPPDLGP
jgi:rhodanese-related sulfurtransferase